MRSTDLDAAAWAWVRGIFLNQDSLKSGLEEARARQAAENEPLARRLQVVDDLVRENRSQLNRLLDLYLTGDFPREVLTERKARLESHLAALQKEHAGLLAHLEASTLTEAQAQELTDFARTVATGLEAAETDNDARRRLIDILDVQATVAVEGNDKVAYLRCLLGEEGSYCQREQGRKGASAVPP